MKRKNYLWLMLICWMGLGHADAAPRDDFFPLLAQPENSTPFQIHAFSFSLELRNHSALDVGHVGGPVHVVASPNDQLTLRGTITTPSLRNAYFLFQHVTSRKKRLLFRPPSLFDAREYVQEKGAPLTLSDLKNIASQDPLMDYGESFNQLLAKERSQTPQGEMTIGEFVRLGPIASQTSLILEVPLKRLRAIRLQSSPSNPVTFEGLVGFTRHEGLTNKVILTSPKTRPCETALELDTLFD